MKNTIVPAQVTSVEDRFAGRLTTNQLIIFITELFINFALFTLLPRSMQVTTDKLLIMAPISLVLSLSAIRYKGKIILSWLRIIFIYKLKPHYYIFDKNDLTTRFSNPIQIRVEPEKKEPLPLPEIDFAKEFDDFQIHELIDFNQVNVSYDLNKEGNLSVYIAKK